MKLKDGKNPKITNSEYHGDRHYLSSSALKMILRNPEEYYNKYILGDLSEEKAHFSFGNYVHTLILEPENVEAEYAIYPGAVRRGKLYDEFKAKSDGKLLITAQEGALATKIMEAYNKHPLASLLFKGGQAEETFACQLAGVPIKVRLDYLKGDMILDVKTTGSGLDIQSLQSTIVKYDYDLSAALYLDAVSAATDKEFKRFIFCFISKTNCDIILVEASEDMIENGRKKYRKAMIKYNKLKAEGFFDPKKVKPAITMIDLPEYGRFQ